MKKLNDLKDLKFLAQKQKKDTSKYKSIFNNDYFKANPKQIFQG